MLFESPWPQRTPGAKPYGRELYLYDACFGIGPVKIDEGRNGAQFGTR